MRPRQQLPLVAQALTCAALGYVGSAFRGRPPAPVGVQHLNRCRSHRPQAYTTSMDHSKLVVVQEYGDRPDAELAVATLSEAGIKAMIQSDSVGGMRDHLAWSGAGFKVLVLDSDSAAAKEILNPNEADTSPNPAQ